MVTPDALYSALVVDCERYFQQDKPVVCHEGSPPLYIQEFAVVHMMKNFTKKFISHTGPADKQALDLFLASNKTCEGWVSPVLREDLSSCDEQLLGTFLKEVEDLFLQDLGQDVSLSWANICENARSGPGASLGARGQSFYAKHFASDLTTTDYSLYNVYKAYSRMTSIFGSAELIRHSIYGSPRLVEGSRTSFVPKNVDVSRMIATEPSLNMFLQLGIGALISKRLQRFFGIDLATQPTLNRRLAKLGSYSDPGPVEFSTIDLSSASDHLSLGLLGWCVPPEWQSVILETRSPSSEIKGVGQVKLSMVSTMGNGYTFPLQTAIFACVASACLKESGVKWPHASLHEFVHCASSSRGVSHMFSVFGDDIIVPRPVYNRVTRLLSLLGFKVNADKSYESGAFKESCGRDYYHGYNVRPVFVRKLESQKDLLVLLNLLTEWTTRTGVYVPSVIQLLLDSLKESKVPVPYDENIDAGIRVPLSVVADKLSKSQRYQSISYECFEPRTARIRIGDGMIHVPRGHRQLIFNPEGLMMAYLYGEIQGGSISIRNNRPAAYRRKRRVTPYWDYQRETVESRLFGPEFDKARWNTVASAYFEGTFQMWKPSFRKLRRRRAK